MTLTYLTQTWRQTQYRYKLRRRETKNRTIRGKLTRDSSVSKGDKLDGTCVSTVRAGSAVGRSGLAAGEGDKVTRALLIPGHRVCNGHRRSLGRVQPARLGSLYSRSFSASLISVHSLIFI
ncbi:hypothetical protein PoB_004891000 [Plakobranchus ocellatus]|uniref:Uncharacterized protein n=1 Tax=Plakobranchus ocellatus TaxID=259542 RepID=A0AAV4BPA5_9GAST|nr:hypothetical protein PoB_004891000 [Plakobranchus ocellatus]